MCLPHSYSAPKGRYSIPKKKDTRANLAADGLIGKVRLSSDMDETEIMSEIRSVFEAPMGYDSHYCRGVVLELTPSLYPHPSRGQPRRWSGRAAYI